LELFDRIFPPRTRAETTFDGGATAAVTIRLPSWRVGELI